jgi:hypothetical protein
MGEETSTGEWQRTLTETNEMAARLESEGWTVATIRAGHVAPEPPSHGDADRFGFVYVAQDSEAAAVRDLLPAGSFDRYEVFNSRVGSDLFTLTRVSDVDQQLAVLLAGAVNLSHASELAAAARDRGEMYSHVQTLDGTHVASFEHDDPEPFLPEDV